MFIKFDPKLALMLCCPFCKSNLSKMDLGFNCDGCGLSFPLVAVETAKGCLENIYDFRLSHPPYWVPQSKVAWHVAQARYETTNANSSSHDSLHEYLEQIDSVKEIYTEEFHISGHVLDVGGHQGRLRYFLEENVTLYVSIDPHIGVFGTFEHQPNLTRAYPCLSQPCNFLAAHAEYLPFKSKSFDWIHMRSVADHFEDPYRAFLEAHRVSKVDGRLLVGLAILERVKNEVTGESQIATNKSMSVASSLRRIYMKWKNGGWSGLCQAALDRVSPTRSARTVLSMEPWMAHDDHMYRFTHSQLLDLMEKTGWRVTKQHRQKNHMTTVSMRLASPG